MKRGFIIPFLFLICANAFGQAEIYAKKTQEIIKLDGILDELSWNAADTAGGFYQSWPSDSSKAESRTQVKVCYNDQFIYVSAVCFHEKEGMYKVSSLKRDFTAALDLFEIYIDPFGDGTNGFGFGVNPMGAEREGMISNGSVLGLAWDNKWYSKVSRHEKKWIVEIAIPFKSLRYKADAKEWKINFARIDTRRNEFSTWVMVPRIYGLSSLAFVGTLKFEEPLRKTGANISLIPYVIGGKRKDFITGENQLTRNIGGDVKLAVTSSLNLDLTFNPDFAQVEVDDQVINTSRFEIYYPEKRQFFLENADLFANFGNEVIRPFFSRRIGVAKDPYTGLFKQSPIIYGARLSGKVNKNWRTGILNMQTAADKYSNLPGTNYSAFAVQRKVFSRSNISAMLLNKQSSISNDTGQNRVAALEYNLASKDNKWTGKYFYHQSFRPNISSNQNAHASSTIYNSRTYYFESGHNYIGNNYDPQFGYVPRKGWKLRQVIGKYFYPSKNNIVNRYFVNAAGELYKDQNFKTTLDSYLSSSFVAVLQNTGSLAFSVYRNYTYLFFPFDPTNTGSKQLEAGTSYIFNYFAVSHTSDTRKLFNYTNSLSSGEYYNGKFITLSGAMAYRLQPLAKISLTYSLNKISLPDPYASARLILLGPKMEFSFTKNLYFSSTFQYNNQINNINSNLRLQWRFKPVSDIFLVYTDNYYSNDMSVKNRGLILKMIYWFNI